MPVVPDPNRPLTTQEKNAAPAVNPAVATSRDPSVQKPVTPVTTRNIGGRAVIFDPRKRGGTGLAGPAGSARTAIEAQSLRESADIINEQQKAATEQAAKAPTTAQTTVVEPPKVPKPKAITPAEDIADIRDQAQKRIDQIKGEPTSLEIQTAEIAQVQRQSQQEIADINAEIKLEQAEKDRLGKEFSAEKLADKISQVREIAESEGVGLELAERRFNKRQAVKADLDPEQIKSVDAIISQFNQPDFDTNNAMKVAITEFEADGVDADDLEQAHKVVSGIFGTAVADGLQDDYLIDVRKVNPDIVLGNRKLKDTKRLLNSVIAGKTNDVGTQNYLETIVGLGRPDLIPDAVGKILGSEFTSNDVKRQATSFLNDLQGGVVEKLDVRGGVKEGFVQVLRNPDGTARIEQITKPRSSTDGFAGSTQAKDTVNNWANSLLDGSAAISSVPKQLKNAVQNAYRDKIESGEVPTNPILTESQLKRVDKLSKDLSGQPLYADTLDVANGFDTISALFGEGRLEESTGFDDIAAINAFQRMVDPGATVREGDVTLLESTIPALKRIDPKFKWKQFEKGDVLPPIIRESMLKVASSIYDTKANRFNETIGTQFKKKAEAARLPFDLIGTEFEDSATLLAPEPLPSGGVEPAGIEVLESEEDFDLAFNELSGLFPDREITDEEIQEFLNNK